LARNRPQRIGSAPGSEQHCRQMACSADQTAGRSSPHMPKDMRVGRETVRASGRRSSGRSPPPTRAAAARRDAGDCRRARARLAVRGGPWPHRIAAFLAWVSPCRHIAGREMSKAPVNIRVVVDRDESSAVSGSTVSLSSGPPPHREPQRLVNSLARHLHQTACRVRGYGQLRCCCSRPRSARRESVLEQAGTGECATGAALSRNEQSPHRISLP